MANSSEKSLERTEEALKHAGPNYDAAEERKFVRKLDMRIMPICCILYLFAFLDRSNIGNARLQGLAKSALHGDPTGVLFDWVNSAFFFSYILCQVPATITSKLFPPRIWIGCAAIGWGLCSSLMAAGYNFAGLIVARVSLGVFEAAFGPGIPLYMSYFYTRHEIGVRLAYWFGFAAVAGAFGGLIAFGVQHIKSTLADWRYLFIIEGVPTIALGIFTMFWLPDRPENTTFFNEREREIALDRANRGTSGDIGYTITKAHILDAFKDWRIYIGGVIYFGANSALASIGAFLPTIILSFGHTPAIAQLLTVPPYAVAAVYLVSTSWVSDRIQSRGIFVAVSALIGAIGYVLLFTVENNSHVRYFAVFCIVAGTYTIIGLVISWYSHNLGSETKRATGTPLYMAIGQCGSVLGAHLYPATEGPYYKKGFGVIMGLEFLGSVCAIILTLHFRWENKRRNELNGKPDPNALVDTSVFADRAPDFRYLI